MFKTLWVATPPAQQQLLLASDPVGSSLMITLLRPVVTVPRGPEPPDAAAVEISALF